MRHGIGINSWLQQSQHLFHNSCGLKNREIDCLTESIEAAEFQVISLTIRYQIFLTEIFNDFVPYSTEHDPLLDAHF